MIVNKKGASMVVAWVLLLGLSISLAILVGTWIKNVSKDTGDDVVVGAEKDQRCADTVLGLIDFTCDVSDQVDSVDLRNTGVFTITKIKCNGVDSGFVGGEIVPGVTSQPLNNCYTGLSNVNIVPFINFEEGEIACAEKSVRVKC